MIIIKSIKACNFIYELYKNYLMKSLEDLNWQVVALKRKTKHEIFTLKVTRVKYLSLQSYKLLLTLNMKCLLTKSWRVIKNHSLDSSTKSHQFDPCSTNRSLRVSQILEEARKYTEIDLCMPDLNKDKLSNKDYVVNVGQRDQNWILHSKYSIARMP